MKVIGKDNFKTLCRFVPRVREAITLTVDKTPIVVSENKYQLGGLESRLQQVVNKALKIPLVIRLYVVSPAKTDGGRGGHFGPAGK